jgi:phage-related protein
MAEARTIQELTQVLQEQNRSSVDVDRSINEKLSTVVDSIKQNKVSTSITRESFDSTGEQISGSIVSMQDSLENKFGTLIGSFEKNRLQELEKNREEKQRNERLIDTLTNLSIEQDDYVSDLIRNITEFLGPVVTALRVIFGAIVSPAIFIPKFVEGVGRGLKDLVKISQTISRTIGNVVTQFKALGMLFPRLGLMVEAIRGSLQLAFVDISRSVKTFVSPVTTRIASLFSTISSSIRSITTSITQSKFVTTAVRSIRSLVSSVRSFFAPIVGIIKTGILDNIQDISRVAGTFFQKVRSFFIRIGQALGVLDDAGKAIGTFAKFVNTVARVGLFLGRLSGVLTIVIGTVSGILGFFRGFEGDTSFIGRLKGGLVGVFDGLVGGLVRTVGSIIDFLLSLIGLDVLGSAIKSAANQFISGINSTIVGILDFVKALFTLNFSGLASSFTKVAKGLLKAILLPVEIIFGAIKQLLSFFGINIDLSVFDLIMKGVKMIFTPFRLIGSAVMAVGSAVMNILEPIMNVIDSVINIASKVASFVKDKVGGFISGAASFLGFGPDEEEAQQKLDESVRQANETAQATAVGYTRRGGEIGEVATMNYQAPGMSPEQEEDAAKRNLMTQGYATMSDEMRAEYQRELDNQAVAAENELNRIKNQRSIGDVFSDISDKMSDTFGSVTESFEGIDLKELMMDIVMSPLNIFRSARDWLLDKISGTGIGDLISGQIDSVTNFLKAMLRSVLPDPTKDYGLLDPRKYVAMALPDKIYEFAGIDPGTGEMIQNSPEPRNIQAGSALQAESEQQREMTSAAEAERSRGGAAGGGSPTVVNNSYSNNQSFIQNRPQASSQPDNASDTVMNGWAP